MNIQVILCILRPYFFSENDLFQTYPPTKARKNPIFFFFLEPSLKSQVCNPGPASVEAQINWENEKLTSKANWETDIFINGKVDPKLP